MKLLFVCLAILIAPTTHALTMSKEIDMLRNTVNQIYDVHDPSTRTTVNKINRAIAERERFLMIRNSNKEKRYVLVNIARQHLDLINDGFVVVSEKVIVGRDDRPTPILSSTMTHIVINPIWNIPTKIAQLDIIPKIVTNKNPTEFAEQRGYRILSTDKSKVSWNNISTADLNDYSLIQNPGNGNALGRLKFTFWNRYGIYIHDTPNKELFKQDDRRFSSGCIRVQYSEKLAAYLLSSNMNDIEKMISDTKEYHDESVFLDVPVPVHIVYWDVYVNEDGTVVF